MTDDEQLWALLADLEARLPFRQESLEQLFAATFEEGRDHARQLIYRAKTRTYELELRAASPGFDGMLVIHLSPPLRVSDAVVHARLPGGTWLPPPPPGWGPPDAATTYVAQQPWGQIWFAFFTGDRLKTVSIAPGMRSSPGV